MSLNRSVKWADKWLRKRSAYYNKKELAELLAFLRSAKEDLE